VLRKGGGVKDKLTPKGKIIRGYKATDKDMKCLNYQFEFGKWHEHDGELVVCSSGFHFCEYPSGPWSFYNPSTSRLFHVEAEFVLLSKGPGADLKHVCKRIKLIEEINCTGNWNTGNWNTGDRNTGDRNTGYRNTGNWNTGDGNTGDRNTGYRNTGNWNTGNWNTGNGNTGDRNTGYRNTGNWNTGDRNTGDRNTGYRNTGYGNVCSNSSGIFNTKEVLFIFDKKYDGSIDDIDISQVRELYRLMTEKDFNEIDYDHFATIIPNASVRKIKRLHRIHIEMRKNGVEPERE
jgi:PPE-repeat protein